MLVEFLAIGEIPSRPGNGVGSASFLGLVVIILDLECLPLEPTIANSPEDVVENRVPPRSAGMPEGKIGPVFLDHQQLPPGQSDDRVSRTNPRLPAPGECRKNVLTGVLQFVQGHL